MWWYSGCEQSGQNVSLNVITIFLTICKLTTHDLLEVFVFIQGLKTDKIHAPFAAEVPAVEPVPLDVGQIGVQPGEVVVVVAVAFHAWSTQP